MTPRTFPEAVSTMGPSYFEEGSTAKASAGIRPPKRAPAAAAPPPSKEDFINARRPILIFRKSFQEFPLLFRRMDIAPSVSRSHLINGHCGSRLQPRRSVA